MSTPEILAELPKLKPEERSQVLQRLCELQDQDLVRGVAGPTEEERRSLDDALRKFEQDGDPGTPWREVLRQVRATGHR